MFFSLSIASLCTRLSGQKQERSSVRGKRALAQAVAELVPLENREYLSTVTATQLAGPLTNGAIYNYAVTTSDHSGDGTSTTTISTSQAFNGTPNAVEEAIVQKDTGGTTTSSIQNYYSPTTTNGFVYLGETASGFTSTNSPNALQFPASLTTGESVTGSYTETPSNSSPTYTINTTTTLLNDIKLPRTVAAGTFQVYEVEQNVQEVFNDGITLPKMFNYTYYIDPSVGVIEQDLSSSGVTTVSTLTSYSGVSSGGGGGGGGTTTGGLSGLTATIAKTTLPTNAVAGAKEGKTVTVDIANSTGSAEKGAAAITLYATTDGTVGSSSIVLGSAKKTLSLKDGADTSATVTVKTIPGSLDGNYTLVAVVTDASDNVVGTATGVTLAVAPPTVTLAPTVTSVTGLSTSTAAISGEKTTGAVKVTIINNGNVQSTGKSTITVSLVSNVPTAVLHPDIQPGNQLLSENVAISIKPGASHVYTIPLKSLPPVADGTYEILVAVADQNGNVTTAESSEAYPLHAPFVQLNPTAGSLKTAKNGTGTYTFTVENEGNIAGSETPTLAILGATSGNASDATTIVSVDEKKKTFAAGKSVKITLKLTANEVSAYEAVANANGYLALTVTSNGQVETLPLVQ